MKMIVGMIAMFAGSFIAQYFLMPPFFINNLDLHTNNLGKVYLSAFMGLFMILIETTLHDYQYHVFSLKTYVLLAIGLGLFVYLYRYQVAINDKEYLNGMIEHHSMAIFTSEEILKKTDNYDVAKLAKNIIQTQKDEIREMERLVKK
uniref:DUF305 domain-containing protein n=1 Tax=viral metagenome TaxID=1070528 RepID=A0A6C0ASD7_9ZZZZ